MSWRRAVCWLDYLSEGSQDITRGLAAVEAFPWVWNSGRDHFVLRSIRDGRIKSWLFAGRRGHETAGLLLPVAGSSGQCLVVEARVSFDGGGVIGLS